MTMALDLAARAAVEDEVPVGALVLFGGRVIGEGRNVREQAQDPLGHAEILAIQDAAKQSRSWRLLGATLVCTLEPCAMCLAAAQQARLSKIIFGAWDPKGGALSLGYRLHEDKRLNHRFEVEYFETSESERMLRDFFKRKRDET